MPQHVTEEQLLERRKQAPRRSRFAWLGALIMPALMVAIALAMRWVMIQSAHEVLEIQRRGLDRTRTAVSLTQPKMVGWNKQGEKVWEITAEEVSVTPRQDRVIFKNADAVFYDKGKENLFIKAGTIEYERYSQNLFLKDGLNIKTREGMKVETPYAEYIHFAAKFVLPQGVKVITKDGNTVSASYMQGDKNLRLLEFVGNVKAEIPELKETEFIKERELTDEEIRLKEFKKVKLSAGIVIYDKERDHIVATGALPYFNPFLVINPRNNRVVSPFDFDQPAGQLVLRKEVNTIKADRIDANLRIKWVKATGNITFTIDPTKPKEGDDPALREVRQERTVIHAGDIEYYWDDDFAKTFSRTSVDQVNKHAEANFITYQGKKQKMVFLEGDIYIEQTEGEWIRRGNLVDLENEDVEELIYQPTRVWGDKAVIFLETNDFTAKGRVKVEQRDKVAWAEAIQYKDGDKKFIAEGNCRYMNVKGEKFFGDQIIFYSDRDWVEINGRSYALVKLPEKYTKDLDKIKQKIKGEAEEEEAEAGEGARAEAPAEEAG